MAEIQVTFVAEDGGQADVAVEQTMTADQITQDLITQQFIPPPPANNYWGLQVKGGSVIQRTQTLQAANVQNGSTIAIQRMQTGGGRHAMTGQYNHFKKLELDYQSMQLLHGPLITWEAVLPFNPPQSYPSKYVVTYHMTAPTEEGTRTTHVVEIDCSSPAYPLTILPQVKFRTSVIMHPHVYSDKTQRICLGGMPLSETLAQLCIRLARFFQYDSTLINPNSIASQSFYNWYLTNRANLPLDHSPLPRLDALRINAITRASAIPQPDPGQLKIKARRPG